MILDKIDKDILALSKKADLELRDYFKEVEDICFINSNRVLSAFINNKVSYNDFSEINGYGNYDGGRDKLERIFAEVLGCEDALVRPQIMSGTNALYLAFSGILKNNDTLISLTGTPYDSLQEMIGIVGDSYHSLKNNGVKYEEIDLIGNDFNYERIVERLKKNDVRMVEIQKSRGYSNRLSLSNSQLEKIIKKIREINNDVIIMVDNCYGELVEDREPGHIGADLVVGSLMKNLGGGIATSGGYIAGRNDLIEIIAERFCAPGVGKNQGANYNTNLAYLKGIFMAPNATKEALKSMIFTSYMLEKLNFKNISPKYNEKRYDIIQAVDLLNKDNLLLFANGLQEGSPIDSFVKVVAAPMPGYPFDEVMACGSFCQGSTIELSCDAPVKEPYTMFIQGGLSYEHAKLSIMLALTKIKEANSFPFDHHQF